jgi:hypothetical protein
VSAAVAAEVTICAANEKATLRPIESVPSSACVASLSIAVMGSAGTGAPSH